MPLNEDEKAHFQEIIDSLPPAWQVFRTLTSTLAKEQFETTLSLVESYPEERGKLYLKCVVLSEFIGRSIALVRKINQEHPELNFFKGVEQSLMKVFFDKKG